MATILFLFASSLSIAGNLEGKVTMIQIGHGYTSENVYALVKFDKEPTGQPACASDGRMAINPATEPGRTMLSVLLAAKATQSTVEVRGKNNCDVMGAGQESISYIRDK